MAADSHNCVHVVCHLVIFVGFIDALLQTIVKLFSPVPDAGACTARMDGTASEIQIVAMQPNKDVQIEGNTLYISNLVNMYPWDVVDHANLRLYHVVPMYSFNAVTQMTR